MTDRTVATLQLIALILAIATVIPFALAVMWIAGVAQDFVLVVGFFTALIAGHV